MVHRKQNHLPRRVQTLWTPEMSAPAQPLWQMDVRHRLGLDPTKSDPINRLLFAALYAAKSEQEFTEAIEKYGATLMAVIEILKGGK